MNVDLGQKDIDHALAELENGVTGTAMFPLALLAVLGALVVIFGVVGVSFLEKDSNATPIRIAQPKPFKFIPEPEETENLRVGEMNNPIAVQEAEQQDAKVVIKPPAEDTAKVLIDLPKPVMLKTDMEKLDATTVPSLSPNQNVAEQIFSDVSTDLSVEARKHKLATSLRQKVAAAQQKLLASAETELSKPTVTEKTTVQAQPDRLAELREKIQQGVVQAGQRILVAPEMESVEEAAKPQATEQKAVTPVPDTGVADSGVRQAVEFKLAATIDGLKEETAPAEPFNETDIVRAPKSQQTLQAEQQTKVAETLAKASPYVVQISSLHSHAEAEDWRRAALRRYAADFQSRPLTIQRSQVENVGVRHRVYVTGFADFKSAERWCESWAKKPARDCYAKRAS